MGKVVECFPVASLPENRNQFQLTTMVLLWFILTLLVVLVKYWISTKLNTVNQELFYCDSSLVGSDSSLVYPSQLIFLWHCPPYICSIVIHPWWAVHTWVYISQLICLVHCPPYISSRFPIPDSRFPIPDSRFPIPDSRFPSQLTRLYLSLLVDWGFQAQKQ